MPSTDTAHPAHHPPLVLLTPGPPPRPWGARAAGV